MIKNDIKILSIIAFWKGANDTSLIEGFKNLGCNTLIINTKDFFSNKKLLEKVHRKLFSRPYRSVINQFNEHIIKTAREYKPNIVFIAKGLWVEPQTVIELRALGSVVVHWHPDDAFNPENTSQFLSKSLPIYDLIITPKSFNIIEYKNIGAKNVLFIPYAYDPTIHYPVKSSNYSSSDVVFIGTQRRQRVKQLSYLYNKKVDLKIYGGQWHKLPFYYKVKKSCAFQEVYAENMSQVIANSKIMLGFLNVENRDLHTARTFEVPACRGFYLSERTEEQMDFFREGIEAAYFSSNEEMHEKIDYYLKNDSLREKIRNSGYERVKSLNATYNDRAERIIKEILTS